MPLYLDYQATAPLRPEAREAWLSASELIGNPSSTHEAGRRARSALEDAREQVAAVVGAEPVEVIFTSGGTEAINLALQGLWRARGDGSDAVVMPDGEHHATIDTVSALTSGGADLRAVPLDHTGRIDDEAFVAALREGGVAFATALAANNEVGTVQNVAGLAEAAAANHTPLHVDAVAALGAFPVSFSGWRADAPPGFGLVAMSVSGHKIGAPVSTGALIAHRTAAIRPVLFGGAAQRDIRPGTMDVAGAAAFAAAAVAAESERIGESERLRALRDGFFTDLARALPEAVVLGDRVHRLPGNIHLLLPGATGESMLFLLDRAGIAVSTGSACQAGVHQPSHVVRAMGYDDDAARQVLRITLGRATTRGDLTRLLHAMTVAYRQLVSPAS